ncbi:MAG: ATP-binding protein [Polyangiaceae bacterium]|nr:ATP-binding protein [Polyangiaceae bacterium]
MGVGIYHEVLALLGRHLAPLNARTVLERAIERHRIASLDETTLALVLADLERGVELFVGRDEAAGVVRELRHLARVDPARIIAIVAEVDISRARNEARTLCISMKARSLTVQCVTTAVSELARNIVSYTPGGKIAIAPVSSAPKRIVVDATDTGKGIADVHHVLSGQYKSRTGLGVGLLGTKRLADRFHVSTGPTGTHVHAEFGV